jgi:hypothetical protein
MGFEKYDAFRYSVSMSQGFEKLFQSLFLFIVLTPKKKVEVCRAGMQRY